MYNSQSGDERKLCLAPDGYRGPSTLTRSGWGDVCSGDNCLQADILPPSTPRSGLSRDVGRRNFVALGSGVIGRSSAINNIPGGLYDTANHGNNLIRPGITGLFGPHGLPSETSRLQGTNENFLLKEDAPTINYTSQQSPANMCKDAVDLHDDTKTVSPFASTSPYTSTRVSGSASYTLDGVVPKDIRFGQTSPLPAATPTAAPRMLAQTAAPPSNSSRVEISSSGSGIGEPQPEPDIKQAGGAVRGIAYATGEASDVGRGVSQVSITTKLVSCTQPFQPLERACVADVAPLSAPVLLKTGPAEPVMYQQIEGGDTIARRRRSSAGLPLSGPIVVRYHALDEKPASLLAAELRAQDLAASIACMDASPLLLDVSGVLNIWLMTAEPAESVVQVAKPSFCSQNGEPSRSILLYPLGTVLPHWISELVAKGKAGPTIAINLSHAALQNANGSDFSIMKCQWMARLWTKLQVLQGLKYYHNAFELCRAIDSYSCSSTHGMGKKCIPHVVMFTGSARYLNVWTKTLLDYVARDLRKLSLTVQDKEIVICTNGFRDMGTDDNKGVGCTIAREYHKLGGSVFHILPMIEKELRLTEKADHLYDGSFLPLDYGRTLFAGTSEHNRRELMAQVCDVNFLIEGGGGAARQTLLCLDIPLVTTVPIVRSGGAASGDFKVPEIERQLHIDPASWMLVADKSLRDDSPLPYPDDETIREMAHAMVAIVKSTLHPLDGVELWGSRFQTRGSQMSWGRSVKALKLPSWKLPADQFLPPREIAVRGGIKPLLDLMQLYEKSLRRFGRWCPIEEGQLIQILTCLTGYIQEFFERSQCDAQRKRMKAAYQYHGQKYRRVYSTVAQDVIQDESHFKSFIRTALRAARLAEQEREGQKVQQQLDEGRRGLEALCGLYRRASAVRGAFDSFCAKVAEATRTEFLKAPLKKMWRSIEKMVLKYADPGGDISRAASGVKDIVRAGIQGNMQQLLDALTFIMESKEVVVVRIKNRFDNPPPTGWQDCQVMLYFADDESRHICEIQLVHPQLMTVRGNMGAHKEYTILRCAMEVLTLLKHPLPTLQVSRSMYFCKVRSGLEIPCVDQVRGSAQPKWGSLCDFRQAHVATGQGELVERLLKCELFDEEPARICDECGVRSLPTATGKCQGCGINLAGVEAGSLLSLAFGISDMSLTSGGKLSLRYQDQEMLVSDNPLSWSPLHFRTTPTMTYIKDWRYLLVNPIKAKKMLSEMFRVTLEATSNFMNDSRWRAMFLETPCMGWPETIQELDLSRFCKQHAVYGFDWPSPNYQLSMQWLVPPIFPWHWHRCQTGVHMPHGQWFPFEFVEAAVEAISRTPDQHVLQRILGAQCTDSLLAALDALMPSGQEYHTIASACRKRYSDAQDRLSRWSASEMFTCVVVDELTVCSGQDAAGFSGQWAPTSEKIHEVQQVDTDVLASYGKACTRNSTSDGCPRSSSFCGSFYSFPKKPEEIRLEFDHDYSILSERPSLH